MYKKQSFSVKITGRIGGGIYWPYGAKCWKDFSYTCQDDDTLRDAILRITNDGDFQYCDIVEGVIVVTLIKPNRRSVRYFDISLRLFTSITDCFVDNPDDFIPSVD